MELTNLQRRETHNHFHFPKPRVRLREPDFQHDRISQTRLPDRSQNLRFFHERKLVRGGTILESRREAAIVRPCSLIVRSLHPRRRGLRKAKERKDVSVANLMEDVMVTSQYLPEAEVSITTYP